MEVKVVVAVITLPQATLKTTTSFIRVTLSTRANEHVCDRRVLLVCREPEGGTEGVSEAEGERNVQCQE